MSIDREEFRYLMAVDEEELRHIIADDSEKSGTREVWRELALRLRYELDSLEHSRVRWILRALIIGFVLGLIVMWLTIKFHWY